MCIHCDWLKRSTMFGAAIMEDMTAVLMNSPRHTPATRAGFTAGCVVQVALQAFFQGVRTGNPAPLEKLLSLVLEWGREHLENWPFGGIDGDRRLSTEEVAQHFPGFEPRAGVPVAGDPLAVETQAAIADPRPQLAYRHFVNRWHAERFSDGTYPTGTKADDGKGYADPAAAGKVASMLDRMRQMEEAGRVNPIQSFILTNTPRPGKKGKRGKKDKKRKGKK